MAWAFKVKLRDLLEDESYDPERELELIPQLGQKVAARLREHDCFLASDLAKRFAGVQTEAAFNRAVEELYDYADRRRIWIG